MQLLDSEFLERVAAKLSDLTPPARRTHRSESWMTAAEIAWWWKEETGFDAPDELDAALVEGWENDARFHKLRIRPAKYPSLDLWRMWGHESVVEPRNREEIAQRRRTPASRFEGPSCPPGGELVFLSHSMLDGKFVARVREALVGSGLSPWLAEERIERGELIFEAVRAALERSKATIVALGRNALGSAWVHTETVGAGSQLFVCDGEDPIVMDLLASWWPPRRFGDVNYEPALLEPLVAAYRQAWETREPTQATLEAALGGTAVRPERPDKFHITAGELLFALGDGQPCVHPRRPPLWRGHWKLQDFDDRIDSCLGSRAAGAAPLSNG